MCDTRSIDRRASKKALVTHLVTRPDQAALVQRGILKRPGEPGSYKRVSAALEAKVCVPMLSS